jgi:hypothetical protein
MPEALRVASMSVATDHVPVYVRTLPLASAASQKVVETHDKAVRAFEPSTSDDVVHEPVYLVASPDESMASQNVVVKQATTLIVRVESTSLDAAQLPVYTAA